LFRHKIIKVFFASVAIPVVRQLDTHLLADDLTVDEPHSARDRPAHRSDAAAKGKLFRRYEPAKPASCPWFCPSATIEFFPKATPAPKQIIRNTNGETCHHPLEPDPAINMASN